MSMKPQNVHIFAQIGRVLCNIESLRRLIVTTTPEVVLLIYAAHGPSNDIRKPINVLVVVTIIVAVRLFGDSSDSQLWDFCSVILLPILMSP